MYRIRGYAIFRKTPIRGYRYNILIKIKNIVADSSPTHSLQLTFPTAHICNSPHTLTQFPHRHTLTLVAQHSSTPHQPPDERIKSGPSLLSLAPLLRTRRTPIRSAPFPPPPPPDRAPPDVRRCWALRGAAAELVCGGCQWSGSAGRLHSRRGDGGGGGSGAAEGRGVGARHERHSLLRFEAPLAGRLAAKPVLVKSARRYLWLLLRRMGRIQSQPMRMDTRILTQKYPIKNNSLGYVSKAYPTRIHIRYAPDTGYVGCLTYPRYGGRHYLAKNYRH
jgi:hypothetical protein